MADFDSDFSSDNKFEEANNIEADIKKYKIIIDKGEIYNSLESIEDLINSCQENELYEDGIYFVERLLEVSPYNSEYWLKKGILLNNVFESEPALECFERALSLNPADSEIYIEKASSEEDLGFFARAKESLITALKIDPNNAETLFSLGLLFQRQERYEEAIEYFIKTIETDKEYEEAYYESGFCYEKS